METNRKHYAGSAVRRLTAETLGRSLAGAFPPAGALPPQPITTFCGGLEIDRARRGVLLAGNPLHLTAREYALLLCLVDSANRVVHRSDLLAKIWLQPDDGSNVVDVYIRRLRQKFGEHGGMILTVRGFGYRLRPPQAA